MCSRFVGNSLIEELVWIITKVAMDTLMVNITSIATELGQVLQQVLGKEKILFDLPLRELMSQDIWAKGTTAAFVARPSSTRELQTVVQAAYERGVPLNPRGGGMSYTKGYLPDREAVGILDTTDLNQIIEINTEDMYVTVQAGVTWSQLYESLKPLKVRTPFWGPLSGLTSTIGGGVSQNNAFFGSGKHGTTGESVLSVTVVLSDGTVLRTGSAGSRNGKPFYRYYGPDLTGLFCGDAGSLGYKAEITLRLIPTPNSEDWASFEFESQDDCARAMADMVRADIACEIFGFDPNLTRVRMARASILTDAKALANVAKSQGSFLKGLKEGAKVALAGRGFMSQATYTVHVMVEGRSMSGVTEDIGELQRIAIRHHGKEIENSIPKIVRANPFGPMTSILGPTGERWVPIHGIVPISEGQETWAELADTLDQMKEELDHHNILIGHLVTTLSTTGFLIEPVFIWPEEIWPIHEKTVGPDVMKKLHRHAPSPEATATVERARERILDVFSKHGAAHFQIGRTYRYLEDRNQDNVKLLEGIKRLVDDKSIVNPGALGLAKPKNLT